MTRQQPSVGLLLVGTIVVIVSSSSALATEPGDASAELVAHYTLPEVTLEGPELSLSLQECLGMALENNLGLKAERLEPDIGQQTVQEQQSAFDITARAEVSNTDTTEQLGTIQQRYFGTDSTDTRTLDSRLTLSKRISTGAAIDVSAGVARNDFDSNIPGGIRSTEYGAQGSVSLTQPLLKNFGVGVNRTQIERAQNELSRSQQTLRHRAEQLVFDVEAAYWDLVFAYQDLRIKRFSLTLAEDLLRINQTRARVGTAPTLDVIESEAEVAKREEALLRAEKTLRDRQDILRQLLNLPQNEERWEIHLVPSDAPSLPELEVNLEQALSNAFEQRADYQAALWEHQNRLLERDYYRNQLLPELNVFASARTSGLETNPSNAFGTATDADYNSFTTGAYLQYPLGNRAASSQYQRSQLRLEQSQLRLADLEQTIQRGVRETARQVTTDRKRVEANRKARYFEERKLYTEQRSYELGVATSHDVLEYQEDLALAQTNEIQATIDYNKSVLAFLREQGILLEQRGIGLDFETPAGPESHPQGLK